MTQNYIDRAGYLEPHDDGMPLDEHLKAHERARIRARLEHHGFEYQHTGGNCTAYARNDGQIEELLTLADDPTAPTALTDQVAISVTEAYSEDEPDVTLGYTLADVLKALDNPKDEYTLLSLRLHNHYHTH